MAGRRPAAALEAFRQPIQTALGCFTDGRVQGSTSSADTDGVLTFNRGEPVVISRSTQLAIELQLHYRIVEWPYADERGPWKVRTTGWAHVLWLDGREFYEFHWHPESRSDEVRPHIHITPHSKRHVPTGRVMVEDVLRLAVEMGATPRDPVRWAEVDTANREAFSRGASWGIGPA